MKEAFCESVGLSGKNIDLLKTINGIIEEYHKIGLRLTLRQLFYALVTRNIILNNKGEYQKLSKILTKGRMAGEVDWSMIVDRGRQIYLPYYCHDPNDAINDTVRQYRLDRQREQYNYVEVMCEKDALSEILRRVTSYYHIRLSINRGYSSCSAVYETAKRIKNALEFADTATILYIGDHDPSGLDMVRDVGDRLEEFGCELDVKHIALTTEQVEFYNPPENNLKKDDFGKLKDPRGQAYFEEFGNSSWEVDALRPEILDQVVRDAIEEIIDMDKFSLVLEMEEEDKEKLREFAANM
jgi:hypothetical protein